MAFSGAVRITDLSDFIAPSQSCVVSLNGQKRVAIEESSEIRLQPRTAALPPPLPSGLRLPAGPRLPGSEPPKEGDAVKVSLHDCLACSGCVTTAETMLLEQQSADELTAALGRPGTCVVVSMAPQSRAALAALYGLSPFETWQRLVAWLRSIGAAHVCDIGTARDLALIETAAEFISRYRASKANNATLPHPPTNTNAQPTTASSPHQLSCLQQALGQAMQSQQGAAAEAPPDPGTSPLPLLASACPGWVCYAEKTQGAAVLPHLSTTKSPQAVMGTIVKRLMASRLGLPEDHSIYHCSVMPCYDKKLEASREELTLPGTQVPEVDCCLTTYELHQLLVKHGVTHLNQVPLPQDTAMDCDSATCACHDKQQTPQQQVQRQQQQQQEAAQGSSEHTGSMACDRPEAQPHVNGGWQGAHAQGVDTHSSGQQEQQQQQQQQQLQQLQQQLQQLQQQLQQQSVQQQQAADILSLFEQSSSTLWGLPGGSGGYMEFVFRVAAAELFNRLVPAGPLPLKQLRNSDFQEVELCDESGQVLLRCAVVYGFRNIQTLMRQIKMRKCQYHYVEVMACPSGCLNGGGQIKPSPGQTPAQVLEAAEAAYHHQQVHVQQPMENVLVPSLYRDWIGGPPSSEAAQNLLHTTYRHRDARLAGTTHVASDW